MKKSYKLIGIEWDHKPYYNTMIFNNMTAGRDFRIDRDLFDLDRYVRCIRISDIMKWNKLKDLEEALKSLVWCDEIQLVIDNEPEHLPPVAADFYYKRVGQIYRYIKDFFRNIPITLIRIQRNVEGANL